MKALKGNSYKGVDTMFWHRRGTSQKGEKQKAVKKIEGELLGYMVSRLGVALDELHELRCVEREVIIGDKPVGIIMIRIFNPDTAKARDVTIASYGSLDSYPGLILYEGHYREVNGEAMDIHMEKK
jgi:hypothetical protein